MEILIGYHHLIMKIMMIMDIIHFYKSIDVTLIGRKTYQQILTFPANEFAEFINQLKSQSGLIDEMILTIISIVLGKGIHLFGQQSIEQQFKYSDIKTFSTGCIQIKNKVFVGMPLIDRLRKCTTTTTISSAMNVEGYSKSAKFDNNGGYGSSIASKKRWYE
ncbi:unnamed protein product [Rotaria sordida]|uniref:Uncharacterized protein n=2 Tax=Rotaria sordida TaxID=392033 RepID=A0A815JRP4_9BILA|nr:unnamed protein product [Rotaria sordida]